MASTIKVDNVQNQPGTNVVNKCGTTVNIGAASDNIRSAGNNLQASDGGNLISQSGTDITLGASGDTINLASGASQSGFGRTGTVDWVTTPKVTGDSPITGVTGKGYFLDTTAGTITLNLPAGAAGSIVSMADYAATWQTNNVTVAANGSEKIGGDTTDVILNTEGQSVTLVYVDSTQGWINTMDSTSNVRGLSPFVHATGGTITCSGDYKIHTFTGPGTFNVTSLSPSAPENAVDWLVAAGGGGGGGRHAGGGGAGGYRESPGTATGSYTVSPLGAAPSAAITVSVLSYPIDVGAGGTAGNKNPSSIGTNGAASSFSTYPSAGGGYGYTYQTGGSGGGPGGSGGGGGHTQCSGIPGGTGNTPPTNPAQGMAGGNGAVGTPDYQGGGGGGATVAGTIGQSGGGGPGGAGATSSINATPTARSGGGGGGNYNCASVPAPGGAGGGGPPGSPTAATAGGCNTGGGGGGYGGTNPGNPSPRCQGANGGSGVVILRYKFQ